MEGTTNGQAVTYYSLKKESSFSFIFGLNMSVFIYFSLYFIYFVENMRGGWFKEYLEWKTDFEQEKVKSDLRWNIFRYWVIKKKIHWEAKHFSWLIFFFWDYQMMIKWFVHLLWRVKIEGRTGWQEHLLTKMKASIMNMQCSSNEDTLCKDPENIYTGVH